MSIREVTYYEVVCDFEGCGTARYVYAIRPATILSLLDDLARVTAERDELERRIHRARHAAEHYAGLANHDGGL